MSKNNFLFLMIAAVVGPILYFSNLDSDPDRETQTSQQMPAKQNDPFANVSFPRQLTTIDTAPPSFINGSPALNSIQNGLNNGGSPNPTLPGIPPELAGQIPASGLYYGNANGPDLSAPMEFMPITNFSEIIRFDINPTWVTNKWTRVSTSPVQNGIRGLRVPLVTGTNSWDLHGSLTYYFDSNQKAQRITFRGWTGDATQLVNLLTSNFDFQKQKTGWAGVYLAKKRWGRVSGGLVMQHPTVIRSDNLMQQLAIVLEINNPQGQLDLSPEFQAYLNAATTGN